MNIDFNNIDPNELYNPSPGTIINTAIEEAIAIAKHFKKEIALTFNGTFLLVNPKSNVDEVYNVWQNKAYYDYKLTKTQKLTIIEDALDAVDWYYKRKKSEEIIFKNDFIRIENKYPGVKCDDSKYLIFVNDRPLRVGTLSQVSSLLDQFKEILD